MHAHIVNMKAMNAGNLWAVCYHTYIDLCVCYVCMQMRACLRKYICVHDMSTCICVCACMCICVCACADVCGCICGCECFRVFVWLCVFMRLCVCAHARERSRVCVFICIYSIRAHIVYKVQVVVIKS